MSREIQSYVGLEHKAGFTAERFPRAWADGDQFITERSADMLRHEMSHRLPHRKRNLHLISISAGTFVSCFYFFPFTFNLITLADADVASWINPLFKWVRNELDFNNYPMFFFPMVRT